jgi:hypothetical protein
MEGQGDSGASAKLQPGQVEIHADRLGEIDCPLCDQLPEQSAFMKTLSEIHISRKSIGLAAFGMDLIIAITVSE